LAVPELAEFIKQCTSLEYLNISDLKMTKSNCIIISEALTDAMSTSSSLRELEWNYDLAVSNTTAKTFLTTLAKKGCKTLQKLSLIGVF
jgi:Ran GTPase-activating protein (RanGAP) involved in mRNA processing and transport